MNFAPQILSRLDEALRPPLQTSEPVSLQDLRALHPDDEPWQQRVTRALAEILECDVVDDLEQCEADEEFVAEFPIALARQKRVLGLKRSDGHLPVVICDEEGWQQLDIVARLLRIPIQPLVADPQQLEWAVNQSYEQRGSQTDRNIQELGGDDDVLKIDETQREDLLDQTGRPTIIRLVNSILFDAAQERASDIHIQPFESKLQVRFRIDGVLFDQFEIPKASQEEVLSRVKIIGNMNIAEKRLPQDGRATAEIGRRLIDLRIASLPTSHGERIVIRLLDKSARMYTLNELGMTLQTLEDFRSIIRLEHGLILVTGPTGSGKSTTLYAALQEINTKNSNVVTLEDPIEYQLDGISQTQVSEKKGMTFARGLRNVLRQDPDIIMIGEIRDKETAEMAIQSALTGHMVFSTLHTNDAASAVTRLLDLGIEPYLVASSVVGVLSQRLVRKICEHCKREAQAEDVFHTFTDSTALSNSFVGGGCQHCRKSGYSGRVGLFELMVIRDSLRSAIQDRKNAAEIKSIACADGIRLLRTDGLKKVALGATSIAEIDRVSMVSAQ